MSEHRHGWEAVSDATLRRLGYVQCGGSCSGCGCNVIGLMRPGTFQPEVLICDRPNCPDKPIFVRHYGDGTVVALCSHDTPREVDNLPSDIGCAPHH